VTTLVVGCGYLGRHVAELLVAQGGRVLGTTRSVERAEAFRAIGIEPVLLDVLDPCPAELPGFDRLVYAVGFDRGAGVAMRDVYVGGLGRFLDRIGRDSCRFVYASSTGVYGQADGSTVTEDDPTEPRHESGKICLEAETLARSRGGIVVRLAGLYGPGRIVRRDALLAGEPIAGDPAKAINLVQIDDAAAATVAALEQGEPGRVYNVADDRPATRDELYRLSAHCLGAPPPRFAESISSQSAGREEANRRVSNCRMKEELRVVLRHPDVTTGIPSSIAAERAAT
jgi:nucleoside-diphosphate-sugar epimerase